MAIDKIEFRILRSYDQEDRLQFRTYDGNWALWEEWRDVPIVDINSASEQGKNLSDLNFLGQVTGKS